VSWHIVDKDGKTLRVYPSKEMAEDRMDNVQGASDIVEKDDR
jgi:hypothetical protein